MEPSWMMRNIFKLCLSTRS
ncbi:unnamed protein product [Timema podura]|uniref:Uncharacterized protein n=1 Tax=Timema podura TaxID=61482 RepID=A0ABN7PLY2_TIMPD|nr:unnamed protein product [Timema podura]